MAILRIRGPVCALFILSGACGWCDEGQDGTKLTNEKLLEILTFQQELDEEIVNELKRILERDRLAFEGLQSLTGAMDIQNEMNRDILDILERHEFSLRLGWFVRLVLLPFSLVSAGFGLRTAWDRYKWKDKLQGLFRR